MITIGAETLLPSKISHDFDGLMTSLPLRLLSELAPVYVTYHMTMTCNFIAGFSIDSACQKPAVVHTNGEHVTPGILSQL